jgi:hypothetical protein
LCERCKRRSRRCAAATAAAVGSVVAVAVRAAVAVAAATRSALPPPPAAGEPRAAAAMADGASMAELGRTLSRSDGAPGSRGLLLLSLSFGSCARGARFAEVLARAPFKELGRRLLCLSQRVGIGNGTLFVGRAEKPTGRGALYL